MKITIGELVNEITKYSNEVNVAVRKDIPFLTATLNFNNGYPKAYLYVAQVDAYTYSACDDVTNVNGTKIFSSGKTSNPFVREIDLIHQKYSGNRVLTTPAYSRVDKVDYKGFLDYLYGRLMFHEIVKPTSDTLNRQITSLGFENVRTTRTLNKSFSSYNVRCATIGDLVNIVNKNRSQLPITDLKSKDRADICNKLSNVGIKIITHDKYITDTTFIRRK